MSTPNLVNPELLARRIRMEMGAQKVSRKRLSEQTGISRPSLANKLDSKVPFTYDEMGRIIAALDLDWSVLFAENPLADGASAQPEPDDDEDDDKPRLRKITGRKPGAPRL